MIFLKDREGRYLYANREFKRVRHITEEHINGKTDNELFPAEQASVFQASDRQVLEARVPIEFEQVTVQKDGQHTSIVQKFPLFNPDGEIYAIGGIVTDITERKREESARRYIEESHRLMVETASDAIVSMDETGAIRFANPSHHENLRLRSDGIDREAIDYVNAGVHARDARDWFQALPGYMASGT